MSECLHEYYVQNGEIKPCKTFDKESVYSDINVYEVIRVIKGVPIFCEAHFDRMKKSMELIKKTLSYSDDSLIEFMHMLIKANGNLDGNIKIIINADKPNRDITLYYINHSYPEKYLYDEGVKTILYHGERENPNAKIVNQDFRAKVNDKIKDEEAYEAILVDNNGYITEGSRSNIFMVKGNKVITSPVSAVLPGITREMIIKVCGENDIEVSEEYLSYEDISKLDGAFISGTSPKVLPIKAIDNLEYKSSQNPIIKEIMDKYNEIMDKYIDSHKKII